MFALLAMPGQSTSEGFSFCGPGSVDSSTDDRFARTITAIITSIFVRTRFRPPYVHNLNVS